MSLPTDTRYVRSIINEETITATGPSVFKVAQWFWLRQWTVEVKAWQVFPDHAKTREYSDAGDLVIRRGTEECRIEVKHWSTRHKPFTCATDFPYPVIIFTGAITYDRQEEQPAAHFVCNNALTHAAIIRRNTKPHWGRQSFNTSNDGWKDNYCIAPSLAEFTELL